LQGPHAAFAVDRTSALPPGLESSEPFCTLAPTGGSRPPLASALPRPPLARPRTPDRLNLTAVLTAVAMIVLMVAGALTAWYLVKPRDSRHGGPKAEQRLDNENGSADATPPKGSAEPRREPAPEPPDWIPKLVQRGDLNLQLGVVGGKPDASGTRELREGQKVGFQIQVDQDAYVGIWTVDSSERITQIFPNEYERNHLVEAGQARTVPGKGGYSIRATASQGTEWVWVVASTEPWNELKGRQKGPFLVFENSEERQEAKRQLRGLELELTAKPAKVLVAQQLIPYRVSSQPESGRK
jgi:hypothetical protein